MNNCFKKIIVLFLTGIILSINFSLLVYGEDNSLIKDSTDTEQYKIIEPTDALNYSEYLYKYNGKPLCTSPIKIEADNFIGGDLSEIQNTKESSLVSIKEGGLGKFSFESKEGLYQIKLSYCALEGNGTNINTNWSIDGTTPFYELGYTTLYRVWEDDYEPGTKKDSRGNDITPTQTEKKVPITTFISDTTGSYEEPFYVYLSDGNHTLEISSNREPIGIYSVEFCLKDEIKDYSKVKEKYNKNNYKATKDVLKTYEAEKCSAKSDSTIYASNDKDSPKTTPYSTTSMLLNSIGGTNFATQGQWIEWEIDAPQNGLYKLAFRVKQNVLSGSFTTRSIYIDDKVPFNECKRIEVSYSAKWQNVSIPGEVYLTKGKHKVRMEVSIGRLGEIIRDVKESVSQLNIAYRNIIMLTGTKPDSYRTYDLRENIPEIFDILEEEMLALEKANKQLIEMNGKRGSMNGILQSFSKQLSLFIEDEDEIQKMLDSYKTNISSLSSWIVSMKSQPLQIDKLYLYSPDMTLPKAKAGFWSQLLHEIKSFFASFSVDYNTIGDYVDESNNQIEVWVQAGRDQANIIKTLILNSFNSENCPDVDLKLVQGQLMTATASGRGPDVALQVAAADPVNYAIRGASLNLKDFEDYNEISNRFRESALLPYEFNGGVYALPETQTFQVMFYRTDILEELELQPPKTWNEMFLILGKLQKKNMTIGIQPPNSMIGNFNALSTMSMLLYQKGGKLYTDNNTKSGLSTIEAQEVFESWVSMYTDYEVPVSYNALNRFRTGEMPIVIEDFSLYNLLQASATEIQGMWSFTSVPGTPNSDAIDYSVAGTGMACMILSGTENREGAWEFLKWWTSDSVQTNYGNEIENKLGTSARYASANIQAFNKMPWSVNELKQLNSLWGNVKGIPEVAGGYFTSRHLNNAFRRVINYGEEPKQTILDYAENIDKEIVAKRKELGIEVG